MPVAKEGAVVGCVGLGGQPQKQRLRKAQSKRELLPKLPDAVQQEQEGRGFLLDAGVGVGRMSAALLERVSRLEKHTQSKMSFSAFHLHASHAESRQEMAFPVWVRL